MLPALILLKEPGITVKTASMQWSYFKHSLTFRSDFGARKGGIGNNIGPIVKRNKKTIYPIFRSYR